jgi:hypothetical protein
VAEGRVHFCVVKDLVVVGGIFREIHAADLGAELRMGGSGLIASILASRLGARTSLLSYVGQDDERMVDLMLGRAEVQADLIRLPGASGTFVFPDERRAGAPPWPMYRPAEAVPTSVPTLPRARGYLLFGIPDFDPLAAGWLRQMPEDVIVVWDQQGWLSRASDSSGASRLPARWKLYLANQDEAHAEFGGDGLPELTKRLPPRGFDAAVIKRGADGAILVEDTPTGRQIEQAAGFPLPDVSSIGSGDAFAGALLAAILLGSRMIDAVRLANAAASCFLRLNRDPNSEELHACIDSLLEDG